MLCWLEKWITRRSKKASVTESGNDAKSKNTAQHFEYEKMKIVQVLRSSVCRITVQDPSYLRIESPCDINLTQNPELLGIPSNLKSEIKTGYVISASVTKMQCLS